MSPHPRSIEPGLSYTGFSGSEAVDRRPERSARFSTTDNPAATDNIEKIDLL
jgi:hypothetical protein